MRTGYHKGNGGRLGEAPKTRTFRRQSERSEGRANNSLITYQSTISGHGGRLFKRFLREKEDDNGKVSKNDVPPGDGMRI
jgi:hypothetical protein